MEVEAEPAAPSQLYSTDGAGEEMVEDQQSAESQGQQLDPSTHDESSENYQVKPEGDNDNGPENQSMESVEGKDGSEENGDHEDDDKDDKQDDDDDDDQDDEDEEGAEHDKKQKVPKPLPDFLKPCENTSFSIANIKLKDLGVAELQAALAYGEDMTITFIKERGNKRKKILKESGGKIGSVTIPLKAQAARFLKRFFKTVRKLKTAMPDLEITIPEELVKANEIAKQLAFEEAEKTRDQRHLKMRLFYVHNLPAEATEEDVKPHFQDSLNITIHEAPEGADYKRYAELEFKKATDGLHYLNKLKVLEICNTKVRLCQFPPFHPRAGETRRRKRRRKQREFNQQQGNSAKKEFGKGKGPKEGYGGGKRAGGGRGGYGQGGRGTGQPWRSPAGMGRGGGGWRFGGAAREYGGRGGSTFGQDYGDELYGPSQDFGDDPASTLNFLKNQLAMVEEKFMIDGGFNPRRTESRGTSGFSGGYGFRNTGGYSGGYGNIGPGGYSGGYSDSGPNNYPGGTGQFSGSGPSQFSGSGGYDNSPAGYDSNNPGGYTSNQRGGYNPRKRPSTAGNQSLEPPDKRLSKPGLY
ncbi:hypothetical protein CHS0354_028086 [Potamilus streckersoni]|uniref:Uncharacterized protein n=1 Tax=Potamilus streckersoni TaxID=2493646 RepID=A0AAE0WEJ4_9BIVA|nr:hypothetical protein CHS0354_028086 [Potamilus streckersoni]